MSKNNKFNFIKFNVRRGSDGKRLYKRRSAGRTKRNFSNFKADIEDNPELSDTEKERQINQLELEYSQLQERWNAEDIQKEREENYVSRDEGLDLD